MIGIVFLQRLQVPAFDVIPFSGKDIYEQYWWYEENKISQGRY